MGRMVLFFNQSREIGGTDTFLTNLIKYWPDKRDKLAIWCNQGHKGLPLYQALNIDFATTTFPTKQEIFEQIEGCRLPKIVNKAYKLGVYLLEPLLFIAAVILFCRKLRQEAPEVVFSNNGGYPAGEQCLAFVIAARLAGVRKIVMIIHNDAVKPCFPRKLWDYPLDMLVSWACSEMVSVSRSCAEQIGRTRRFNRKIKFIYNGIPAVRWDRQSLTEKKAKLGINDKQRIIGSIGDYEERKGQEYLIEAFNIVKEQYPELKLVMIGSGAFPYAEKLKKMVNSSNYGQDIYLTDYLPNAWEYIECFDILILPSVSFESFGMVLLEAMLYKKPVIGTAVGGIPEVIGDAGFIVEPRSAAQLAEKIVYLLNNSEIAKRMGENSYAHLKANFAVEKMADQYYELCRT